MFSILKKLFRRESPPESRTEPSPEPPIESQEAGIKPEPTAKSNDMAGVPPITVSEGAAAVQPKSKRRRKKASRGGGKQHRKPPSCNRHGIPVFKKDADISQLFENRPEERIVDGEDLSRDRAPRLPSPRKVRRRPRNKNGIPVFGEATDFSAIFRDSPSEAMAREAGAGEKGAPASRPDSAHDEFQGLLEASLAGKSLETLLLEKSDEPSGETPLTPEQAIRRYPPPQEELDLHGHTSQQAIDSTRAFVEKARYRGKRTVLVIVGKGLHSEGRAILPDVVEAELARLRQTGRVLAHRWERGAKRKSGAILVYLNPI